MELSDLAKPFPASDIEFRIQRSGINNGKPWAMVLAYVTNRAIMDRLDSVCGPASWQNDFKEGPNGGLLCGLSIFYNGAWVTKWDGADNTQVEAIKGGLSGAMKRAGSQWGIGRYLYKLDATFANISDKGKLRGVAKVKGKADVYFKWDPPGLPEWALPKSPPVAGKPPKAGQTSTEKFIAEMTAYHKKLGEEMFVDCLKDNGISSMAGIREIKDMGIKNKVLEAMKFLADAQKVP